MIDVVISGVAWLSARADAANGIVATDLQALDWNEQIPNRSDQRAQGLSQLIASYTAGCALDQAGLKGDAARLEDMNLFVATPGGERDESFDLATVEIVADAGNDGVALNQQLSNLRPSLFLSELQNLFAANISIAYGVLGTSITFMGGVDAGIDAVELGWQRIGDGRCSIALVGGVFNGFRQCSREMHMARLVADEAREWLEQPAEGVAPLGAGCAFLVLESAESAAARNRAGCPHLRLVKSLGSLQHPDVFADVPAPDTVQLDTIGCRTTAAFARPLDAWAGRADRRNASLGTGALMEAAFPLALALAVDAGAGQVGKTAALAVTRYGEAAVAMVEWA